MKNTNKFNEKITYDFNTNINKNTNNINNNNYALENNGILNNSSENNYITKIYTVTRIIPEGTQKGILIIYSNNIIKFKPVINNYKNKSLEIKLSKFHYIIKYRYLFRYKAINIFLFQSQRSKIFDFETEQEFTEFYDFCYLNCKNLDKNIEDIDHYTNLWKFGSITNYDYILYLNTLASRSFSDLSQYPIFPWVISNYEDVDEFDISDPKNYRDLSKPIGAVSQYKLDRFLENYNEMKKNQPNDKPCIYGDHYSIPSHVVYYLVRAQPLYQMKLKSGSMGPPDRLFNSMKDCWNYIFSINNDVKELIPEFYGSNGDFLLNIHNLNLGETTSKKSVDDVILPKWAKSPLHFVNICRSAFESKHVSSNINHWIDLIFGYKQKDDCAIAANNLFYYMSYESALEKNCDKNFEFENDFKKQAFFTQISEYGQIPRCLFSKPHPVKKSYSLYNLNNFLGGNPEEEILIKIEMLKNENKKLEENCQKLEREKIAEKESLIKNHNEIEMERQEKIKNLKM